MKAEILGYVAAIGFVGTTILSMFFVQDLIVTFPNKYMVLFLACLVSSVFFTLINIKCMPAIFKCAISSWHSYLFLAVLIGSNWICSIFGIPRSNAFLYSLGYFMFSASLAYLNDYLTTKDLKFGLLCMMSWIILLVALAMNLKFILGFLIALLGGATGYLYRRTTYVFSEQENFSSSQILSIRFYPLLILLSTQFHLPDLVMLSTYQWSVILLFAVLAFIIPNYLNQVAIIKLGANHSTVIAAFIFPVSCLLEQILHRHISIDANLIVALIATLTMLIPFVFRFKRYSSIE